MSEETDNIMKGLLQDLSVSKESEKQSCATLDKIIDEILANLEEVTAERSRLADPFKWQQEKIESEIKELATIMAKSFKSDLGEVKFRKGYIRRSYDTSALDKICSSDEMIKKVIWPFRKESPIEPSITITTITPVLTEVKKPKIELVEEI